jgi:hypothetical protein
MAPKQENIEDFDRLVKSQMWQRMKMDEAGEGSLQIAVFGVFHEFS